MFKLRSSAYIFKNFLSSQKPLTIFDSFKSKFNIFYFEPNQTLSHFYVVQQKTCFYILL